MNIPLNEWSGSKDVKETLERIQKDNAGTQRWMVLLTFIARFGTVIVAVPVARRGSQKSITKRSEGR
jgi:hypothetical protein